MNCDASPNSAGVLTKRSLPVAESASSTQLLESTPPVIRVPIPITWAGICPCAYTVDLPSPKNCVRPGAYGELAVAMTAIFGYINASVRIVPANGVVESEDHNDLSIMDQLYSGAADLSINPLYVSRRHVGSRFGFAPMIGKDSLVYIYKIYDTPPPELSLSKLFVNPSGYWCLIILSTVMRLAARRFFVNDNRLGGGGTGFYPLSSTKTNTRIGRKFGNTIVMIAGLFNGIALSALASRLFFIFSYDANPKEPIGSAKDLADRLYEGSFRAFTTDAAIYTALLDPNITSAVSKEMFYQFKEAARLNPPEFSRGNAGLEAIGRRLTNQQRRDRPQLVYVSFLQAATMLQSLTCGLKFAFETETFEGFGIQAYFWRKDFINRTVTRRDMYLIEETVSRTNRKYYPTNPNCSTRFRYKHEKLIIRREQLTGVFMLAAALFGAAAAYFLWEILIQKLFGGSGG